MKTGHVEACPAASRKATDLYIYRSTGKAPPTSGTSALVAEQAPVNDHGGPTDHGGLVTQQKQHSVGHVVDF